jgi:hypothetical protein
VHASADAWSLLTQGTDPDQVVVRMRVCEDKHVHVRLMEKTAELVAQLEREKLEGNKQSN